jgi:predicted ATP-binding protein involved in virulence
MFHCRILFELGLLNMTDIYETEFAYEAACKEKCISANPMITDVLALDRDENLLYVLA